MLLLRRLKATVESGIPVAIVCIIYISCKRIRAEKPVSHSNTDPSARIFPYDEFHQLPGVD